MDDYYIYTFGLPEIKEITGGSENSTGNSGVVKNQEPVKQSTGFFNEVTIKQLLIVVIIVLLFK